MIHEQDRIRETSRLARVGLVRRFLRFPLYHKIVVANSLFVASVAVFATLLTWRMSSGPDTGLTPGMVTALVLLAVVLMAGANAVLVRLALSALQPVEDTARRVELGDVDARCTPSPLADDDLLRLTQVVNGMLDHLEEGRIRQRELAVKVLEAEERERMWLARELLDDTAQVLAATLLHLRAATRVREADKDAALAEIRNEIVEALEGIRKIARRLRPPELDELGLAAAVVAHGRSLSQMGGVPVSCQAEEVDSAISREARLTLYRIIQEALNNAVRHASPQHVEARLFQQDGWVVAEIVDDGIGFDTSAVPRSDGNRFGLLGIEERTRYLGGRMVLNSEPGRGTSLRVEIPTRGVPTEVMGSRAPERNVPAPV